MQILELVQNEVAGHMDAIKANFRKEAKITVLVRLPENSEADFVMTDDEIDEAIAALQRRKSTEPKS